MVSRKIKILIVVTGIVSLFFLLRALTNREQMSRGFPIPEIGAHVGTVNIPGEDLATFYLERLREGDTLLAIVFAEGFQPQSLFPERLLRVEGQELYRPLFVKLGERGLRLSGVRQSPGKLQGKVKTETGESGDWSLRRLDSGVLKRGEIDLAELAEILKAKDAERRTSVSVESVRALKNEIEERIRGLERALSDQAALRTKASQRRDSLKKALQEKKEFRTQVAKSIDTLAGELELISRISKRGQAVSLERRILQREHRWYEVHWQSDEEIGQTELPDAGIDLAKFNQAVRQAQETRALLRERDDELRKIRELESAPEVQENAPTPESPVPQEGLWNRLFG